MTSLFDERCCSRPPTYYKTTTTTHTHSALQITHPRRCLRLSLSQFFGSRFGLPRVADIYPSFPFRLLESYNLPINPFHLFPLSLNCPTARRVVNPASQALPCPPWSLFLLFISLFVSSLSLSLSPPVGPILSPVVSTESSHPD
ncbi:hypothetical protein ACMYSQ_011377 [Aspergillus niger]